MRNPPRRDLALEALLEERDHLKIRISLLEDSMRPDAAKLKSMRRELADLESRISRKRAVY